jgi:hypothetical protein
MAVRAIKADEVVRLYQPVGQIIVLWSLTDLTISHIGFLIMRALKRPEDAERWPVMFGRRLSTLETYFKRHREFADLRFDFSLILSVIKEMTTLRDMLIHGVPVRYDEEKDAVIFHRVDRLSEKQKRRAKSAGVTHFLNRMTVRFETLEEAMERCIVINDRLAVIRDALRKM